MERPSTPVVAAHPRSRGENSTAATSLWRLLGSSPLTRGKRAACNARADRRGLIPAHAGKTPFPRPWESEREAHPRSRGENSTAGAVTVVVSGSSPLTRGKHRTRGRRRARRRLIPAHAGKTHRRRSDVPHRRAHPRSRGENRDVGRRGHAGSGSSPLTRGKLAGAALVRLNTGLIPAHAGKTPGRASPRHAQTAHPRSRGENPPRRVGKRARSGSSPLTRGKPTRSALPHRQRRLIPAHAGKTLPDLRFYCADRSDLGKP